jgi:hypothetical protein
MKKYVDVQVVKADISAGCPVQANNCPIARAIRRALDYKYKSVVGFSGYISVTKNYRLLHCKVIGKRNIDKVDRFIGKFDGGKNVRPIKFRMKLLEVFK